MANPTDASRQAKGSDAGTFEKYWAACNHRVTPFVDRHYRWPGVYALHWAALGLDLLKAPANVFLALPALMVQIIALALRRLGAVGPARRLLGLPLGFQTAVEKALGERLRREVLELEGAGRSEWEALVSRASFDPRSRPEREQSLTALGREELYGAANALIERYAETRRAVADVTTALIVGIAGVVLVDRFTPGSISAGQELAASVSHYAAVHDFFLGPTLGGWFYHFFPPETALWTEIVAIVVVALFMSLVSAFSGLLADPAQAYMGLHQRRLRRWLRTFLRLVGGSAKDDYRPWDPYMARIVDVVDAVKGLSSR